MTAPVDPTAAQSPLPAPPDDSGAMVEERHVELGAALVTGVVVFALGAWAFSGLMEEVLESSAIVRWDVAASAWLHARNTPGGLAFWHAVTQLGQPGVWATMALGALWLWRRHERLLLGTWLLGNAGGVAVDQVLKAVVQRPRPEYAVKYLHHHSFSFPSGHSMMSAVCYGLLAAIAADLHGWTRPRRALLFAAAALLVAMIAFSRVYLGVHFPSDVAGGVAAGVAWVAACRVVLRLVQYRAARRRAARRSLPTT